MTARLSAREIAGASVSLIGVAALLTTAVVNPWVLPLAVGSAVASNADVLFGYLSPASRSGCSTWRSESRWRAAGRRASTARWCS